MGETDGDVVDEIIKRLRHDGSLESKVTVTSDDLRYLLSVAELLKKLHEETSPAKANRYNSLVRYTSGQLKTLNKAARRRTS